MLYIKGCGKWTKGINGGLDLQHHSSLWILSFYYYQNLNRHSLCACNRGGRGYYQGKDKKCNVIISNFKETDHHWSLNLLLYIGTDFVWYPQAFCHLPQALIAFMWSFFISLMASLNSQGLFSLLSKCYSFIFFTKCPHKITCWKYEQW